jgi:hypothetical protein
MNIWLKNSKGEPSASLTFVSIAFFVIMLWLTLSIFSKIGHIQIREFSGSEAMSILGPLLATYFGRRFTDSKQVLEAPPAANVPSQQ